MDIKRHNQRFNKIYGEYADVVFRFCLLRVADREQALDIAEETFVRLWQTFIGQRGTREVDNPKTFLFTVAHNLIIDWYRKKKTVSLDRSTDDSDIKQDEPADQATITDPSVGAEGRFLLEKLNTLEETDRDVIRLRFIEGLSPPEIGIILGISTNAASVRLNRGIKKLREIVGYNEHV